jgi:hypothetical protein
LEESLDGFIDPERIRNVALHGQFTWAYESYHQRG